VTKKLTKSAAVTLRDSSYVEQKIKACANCQFAGEMFLKGKYLCSGEQFEIRGRAGNKIVAWNGCCDWWEDRK